MQISGYKLIKANFNMPHRCDKCWHIPDILWEDHHKARWFYIYRCESCKVCWNKFYGATSIRWTIRRTFWGFEDLLFELKRKWKNR